MNVKDIVTAIVRNNTQVDIAAGIKTNLTERKESLVANAKEAILSSIFETNADDSAKE